MKHATDGLFWDRQKIKEKFLSLPHPARLAYLRDLGGKGGLFAEIISHIIQTEWIENKISKIQLWEIVEEYLNRDNLKEYYQREIFDGWVEYQNERNIEQIWSLIPLFIADLKGLSESIISHAPYKPSLHGSSAIPEYILHSLDNVQLSWLLERADIDLCDFRKEIFFREIASNNSDNEMSLLINATSHNFTLTIEEFGQIIDLPRKNRIKALKALSWIPSNLSLIICFALRDLLEMNQKAEEDYHEHAWEIKRIENEIETKIKSIINKDKEAYNSTIMELKVYFLSKKLIPWTGISDFDQDLKDCVSEEVWNEFKLWTDAGLKSQKNWDVFLSLRKTLSNRQWRLFEPLFPVIEQYIDGQIRSLERIDTAEEIAEKEAMKEPHLLQVGSKINELQASINTIKTWIIISGVAILWLLFFR